MVESDRTMIAVSSIDLFALDPSSEAGPRVSFGPGGDGFAVPLRPLGGSPAVEMWPDVPGLIFGACRAGEAGSLDDVTRDVYGRMVEAVRSAGHPHFVRVWNYVGAINEEQDGIERYQRFCAGRHEALVSAGYALDQLPAASAVGMPDRGLITCFLAASEPGRQIENPRQVSAYHYPPQYGVRSPSFARATLWREALFVSGTSSVVGHASVHSGDVLAQLEETIRNIEVVIAEAIPAGTLDNIVSAKTYLRHAADYDRVAARLAGVLPANLYLEADICRSELLIEIEAIAR